ncbi:MAG: T9SS type A sorting domain-containing protein [Chitinophagales bacterium]|nr:T9SS type A sorting domain-containing protein [Bacteroidota bacterium]MBX7142329.1 T9SS type A sorting domain-containing protein [Chitinophagales bacterium]
MKKSILALAVFAWLSYSVHAQVLTIDQANYDLTVNADEMAEALSYVTNTSGASMSIKWVRYVDVQPSGWDFAICDPNNCYNSILASQTFNLSAGHSGLMKMDVSPYGNVGYGSYHINIFNVNDSANAHVTMTVNVTAESNTGISNVNKEVISVYPNPAKDVLNVNLDAAKKISAIEIYNVVGQKIKTVNLQQGITSITVPVSDLKKGVYFVRAISNGKEILTKTFSKD